MKTAEVYQPIACNINQFQWF